MDTENYTQTLYDLSYKVGQIAPLSISKSFKQQQARLPPYVSQMFLPGGIVVGIAVLLLLIQPAFVTVGDLHDPHKRKLIMKKVFLSTLILSSISIVILYFYRYKANHE